MAKLSLPLKALLLGSAFFTCCSPSSFAQSDTLRVLSYNILYLGDTPPCQGPHDVYEGYLKTVIADVSPDIAGFDKMEAIPVTPGDMSGSAPYGFADSVLQNTMNAAFPGRYAFCPFTNTSGAGNISLLFYNQQKLGFVSILSTYVNITDFTSYKLYYKSADLATTHDSIFLYVTLNHTNSGSSGSDATIRGQQIAGEMTQIESHFSALPNMINMGDFNTHTSTEACYQTLIAPANPNYRYCDPPFSPDGTYSYPANWDANPDNYAAALTVSTRESGSLPNPCSGNSGGAKSWYDHIFLSAAIIENADHIGYLPHSFTVVGNDGNHVGAAVNGSPANTSAPAAVIEDIYQLSEHYPIMLDLVVNNKVTNAVATVTAADEQISVVNPVSGQLLLHFPGSLSGKTITVSCIDALGRLQQEMTLTAAATMTLPCKLIPGIYYLRFIADGCVVAQKCISKK